MRSCLRAAKEKKGKGDEWMDEGEMDGDSLRVTHST